MNGLIVVLGVPPRILSPNARPRHWGAKYRAGQSAKYDAHMAALAALDGRNPPLWVAVVLEIRWFGTTRSVLAMDRDNAIGSLKSAFDGLTDAGVWVDDHGVAYAPGQPVFAVDRANPRVELVIRPGSIYPADPSTESPR